MASGLKVGTEHVYKVLIKQQIVYSISWIIILIIVIMFTNIFKKAYLYTKENWEEAAFVPFTFLGIITLTILYIIVFCNIEGMITGLINPEYGAIKDIINFIKK